jgi:hypothetical protein
MIYFADNLPTRKLSYEQLDTVINHACDVLGIPEDISIEILFTYDIVFPQYGDADVEQDDDTQATIRVNRRASKEDIIATLFHEMVHVNQIISGMLTLGEGSRKSTWNGNVHEVDYFELPWERQAFELEQYMMATYKEKYNGIYRNGR